MQTITLASKPYAAALLASAILYYLLSKRARRASLVPPNNERVLILGATSGIGQSIALQYAQRGASVCIVGRRQGLVNDITAQCSTIAKKKCLGVCADFTDADGLLRVREAIAKEWGGLDTLTIVAGVSALLPVMDVAQVPNATGRNPDRSSKGPSKEGIERTRNIAHDALKGNYIGPLMSAVTFIPLLQRTSRAPAIALISSLAAVVPAPTRALYGSSKSACLILFQSLSIEHPLIAFTHLLPSTVEGDFRAGAVDGGAANVREADPNKHGLKRGDVAARCIRAVDGGEKTVFVPGVMRAGMWLYWWVPRGVEWLARRKYHFQD